jgi:hypothetical protein
MSDMPIQARTAAQPSGVETIDAAHAAQDAGAAAPEAPSAAQTTLRAPSGAFGAVGLQAQLLEKLGAGAPGGAASAAKAPEGYGALDAARDGDYVRTGSSGESVAALQRALKAAGLDVGEAGKFDAATLAAVKKFQQEHGCKVDGIVGPETMGALDKALGLPVWTPPPLVGPTGEVGKTGNAFIDSIAAGAVESMRRTGVPASVTIAQAILESGWGKSGLSKDHFNFFGIKGRGPAGSANLETSEFLNGQWVKIKADFRAYHNAAESLVDHANVIAHGKPYARAMSHKGDAEQFARDLTGVYATDPGYGDKLVKIMRQFGLARLDAAAGTPAPKAE